MDTFLEQYQRRLHIECGLNSQQPLVAGVSGGPDSLCLAHALWRLGIPLHIVHVNHGLRPEAAAEAGAVERFAAGLGVPFHLVAVDAAVAVQTEKLSIEEAARGLRYRSLFRIAQQVQAQAVAVGHTADDQVETVLMHFLRGSGLAGLKGMLPRSLPNAWSQVLPVVRPLLGVWRREVEGYVQEQGLLPSTDPSNQDVRFFRNRLRHELLPELETYNPRLRSVLWRMANVLAAEDAALQADVEAIWEQCFVESGGDGAPSGAYTALDRRVLLDLPLALQRRVVRRALGLLRPGLRDIDFDMVEAVLQAAASPRPLHLPLAGAISLRLEGTRLWLLVDGAMLPETGWPQIHPDQRLLLDVPSAQPGEVPLLHGWRLRAERRPMSSTSARFSPDTGSWEAWLAAGSLDLPLQVRTRRPGDRLQPLGMDGRSLKLSDLFINLRIPERARPGWPLVLSGEQIAWVPGLRLAHPFRVVETTREVVHLWVEKT